MEEYITDIGALIKKLNSKPVRPDKLVSEHSSENTVQLFEYLKDIYGKKTLAGQQYLQRRELEDDVYFAETGDLPAVRGYDLMDIDKEKGDDQVDRAIKWAEDTGCIITMCWHWYAPDDMNDMGGCDWSFYYKTTTYDHKTSFDLLKAVEYGTAEYEFAVSRIDKAAEALRKFDKHGIPVLFRPLHEANGDWFWWGRRKNDGGESAEAYKASYIAQMQNGLLTQLVRINLGNNIEEAHMRNRALIARWAYEHGKADNVMELVKRDGKTFVKINDYQKLRGLFGELLAEIQRVKSTGDFKGAQTLVETYGVKIDPELHKEILDRYAKLNIAPYKGFINPVYTAVRDAQGNITDVTISYTEGYAEQMLRYSKDYSTLPLINE